MAIPNEQANEASRTGGVLTPASKDPHSPEFTQLAGWFSTILKNADKFDNSVTSGKRVPMAIEERLLKKGDTTTKIQDSMAEEVLSPKGLEDFKANNNVAVSPKELLNPKEDLVKMADDEFTLSQQISDAAILAAKDKPKGLASDGDAEDLLTGTANKFFKTDKGIDFNFEKMNSSEDVLEVINGVSEIISKGTVQFKRGKVSNNQTLDEAMSLLADETGFTKTILKKGVGTTLNATEMTALRIMLQNSAEKLSLLGKEIQAGADSNDNLLRFRRLMAIHSGLQMRAKGAQVEIARAMQAFSMPIGVRDPINIGNVKQELLDEGGGAKLARKLVDAVMLAESKGKKDFAEAISKGWQVKTGKVYQEVYINGLLANTKTALKNFTATPTFIVYNQLTDLFAASVMTVVRGGKKVLGKDISPDGVFFSDIVARNMGMMKGFKDAWLSAYQSAKTEIPAGRMNKIEGYNAIDTDYLEIPNLDKAGTLGTAINYLGRAIRIPGAALQSGDDFWRIIVQRGALHEQAIKAARIVKMNGGTDIEASDAGLKILLDTESVKAEVELAGNKMLLTENLEGFVGSFSKSMQNNFIGKLLLPFAKAPTNGIRMVAESHPLTLATAIFPGNLQDNLLGKNGNEIREQTLSRFAVGSMTMYQVYQWADEGRLTGAMPRNPKIRALLPKNWQPYSFVFRGDNFPKDANGDDLPIYDKNGIPNGELLYVNYAGLEPVSAIFGIGADCAERRKRVVKETDRESLVVACTAATLSYFKQIPFLTSMSSVFAAIEYEDATIILRSPMNNMVGVIPVPFSSMGRVIKKGGDPQSYKSSTDLNYYSIADVQKMYDDSILTDEPLEAEPWHLVGTVKDEGSAKEFFDGSVLLFKDQMKNNPWYKKIDSEFQFQYDVLGNKLKTGVSSQVNPVQAYWNLMTPFNFQFGEVMPEWQKELIKIGMPLKSEVDVIEGIELSNARKGQLNFIAKDPENETAIKLQIMPGTEPLGFQAYLEEYIKTADYVDASRKEKINFIKRVENDFYEAAFMQLKGMPENEDLYNAFEERNEDYVQGAR